jgi:hypothetical protein
MTQTAKLPASEGPNQALGFSVAVSGATVVAGAPYATIGGNLQQGAAYVFVEPAGGWANVTQSAKLTALGGSFYDSLGSSVAVRSNTILVGAPRFSGSGFSAGGAYLFAKPAAGWADETQSTILTGSDAKASSYFGTSLQIEGNTILVGTAFNKPGADGAASIFGSFQY